ncbi:MAG: hypothetical protein CMI53_05075 [Parcubacteria group bacterium]|jgi:hypothetical protein|nr:hypothetical protein [Parcubacteria group bacterium]|tara:strand:+ start:4337 stop:4789 length:453 start_codon:yes stop_codon:yes gene_type:complete
MIENKLFTKRFFIFLILPLMAIFLAGCFNKSDQSSQIEKSGTEGKNNVQNIDEAKDKPSLSAEELAEDYRTELKNILQPFFAGSTSEGIKDKVLNLKAPAKYIDLHFSLVVTLELIEQGKANADQAKIEQGLEQLDVLKIEYSWLGNNQL